MADFDEEYYDDGAVNSRRKNRFDDGGSRYENGGRNFRGNRVREDGENSYRNRGETQCGNNGGRDEGRSFGREGYGGRQYDENDYSGQNQRSGGRGSYERPGNKDHETSGYRRYGGRQYDVESYDGQDQRRSSGRGEDQERSGGGGRYGGRQCDDDSYSGQDQRTFRGRRDQERSGSRGDNEIYGNKGGYGGKQYDDSYNGRDKRRSSGVGEDRERSFGRGDQERSDGRRGNQNNDRGEDWICEACNFKNFANRKSCKECAVNKPAGGGGSRGGNQNNDRGEDWICESCNFKNFASRRKCKECEANKPAGAGGSGRGAGADDKWQCHCGFGNFKSRRECLKCQTPNLEALSGEVGERALPYEPPKFNAQEALKAPAVGSAFDDYDKIEVNLTGENKPKPIQNLARSGLEPFLVQQVGRLYKKLTPVQKYSLPIVMAGRDLMATAQTGSGKTAAFLLPIISDILKERKNLHVDSRNCRPIALIMSPTRELAVQIWEQATIFTQGSDLQVHRIYGGTTTNYTRSQILNEGTHILVATPGRLKDFVERGWVTFEDLKYLVLDEADRMLDMGFISSIDFIVQHPTMPPKEGRQTLMFSATFSEDIQRLAKKFLTNYLFLAVGIVGGACKDVEQTFLEAEKMSEKKELLVKILEQDPKRTLIFVETKKSCDFLAMTLSAQYKVTSIHGNRHQFQREEALNDFKRGTVDILVATSVAARGLDIENVRHVINFDLPKDIDEYVHRIGRTGRLGNFGKSTSFYNSKDSALAGDLVKILKGAGKPVPDFLDGYSGGLHGENVGFGGQDIRGGTSGGNMVEEEDWD